jgi:hypothetical protein
VRVPSEISGFPSSSNNKQFEEWDCFLQSEDVSIFLWNGSCILPHHHVFHHERENKVAKNPRKFL